MGQPPQGPLLAAHKCVFLSCPVAKGVSGSSHPDDQGLLLFRPGFPQTCCFQKFNPVPSKLSPYHLHLPVFLSCPAPLISPQSPRTSACPQESRCLGCGCRHRAERGAAGVCVCVRACIHDPLSGGTRMGPEEGRLGIRGMACLSLRDPVRIFTQIREKEQQRKSLLLGDRS